MSAAGAQRRRPFVGAADGGALEAACRDADDRALPHPGSVDSAASISPSSMR